MHKSAAAHRHFDRVPKMQLSGLRLDKAPSMRGTAIAFTAGLAAPVNLGQLCCEPSPFPDSLRPKSSTRLPLDLAHARLNSEHFADFRNPGFRGQSKLEQVKSDFPIFAGP